MNETSKISVSKPIDSRDSENHTVQGQKDRSSSPTKKDIYRKMNKERLDELIEKSKNYVSNISPEQLALAKEAIVKEPTEQEKKDYHEWKRNFQRKIR